MKVLITNKTNAIPLAQADGIPTPSFVKILAPPMSFKGIVFRNSQSLVLIVHDYNGVEIEGEVSVYEPRIHYLDVKSTDNLVLSFRIFKLRTTLNPTLSFLREISIVARPIYYYPNARDTIIIIRGISQSAVAVGRRFFRRTMGYIRGRGWVKILTILNILKALRANNSIFLTPDIRVSADMFIVTDTYEPFWGIIVKTLDDYDFSTAWNFFNQITRIRRENYPYLCINSRLLDNPLALFSMYLLFFYWLVRKDGYGLKTILDRIGVELFYIACWNSDIPPIVSPDEEVLEKLKKFIIMKRNIDPYMFASRVARALLIDEEEVYGETIEEVLKKAIDKAKETNQLEELLPWVNYFRLTSRTSMHDGLMM